MKNTYEIGMKINYDPVSKRAVVAFRGRITVLPIAYETESEAFAAGESHCRSLGWAPAPRKDVQRGFRSLW